MRPGNMRGEVSNPDSYGRGYKEANQLTGYLADELSSIK